MLLSSSAEQGEIEHEEQEMLYKVFDFADKEVADVMVPRPEVVGDRARAAAEEALKAVLESPYTRYPVYRESLDDIVGVLHIRDLIEAMHDRGIASVDLRTLVRPAYMVPETKDLGALLTEFRRTNQHLAIVIDEYGSMEGIVTLEDLLEEIVGEIEDEFDLPDETVERVDERHDPHRRHVPDRRLQRAVRLRPAARGLPHGRRLRLRPARARRPSPATRCATTGSCFQVESSRGPAHRPADRHVPAVAPAARRRRADAGHAARWRDVAANATIPGMDDLRPLGGPGSDDPRLAAYLEKVRARAYTVADEDVQGLKDAGVAEDEIFEQTVQVAIGEGLPALGRRRRAIG